MENVEKCTVAMLGGLCSQQVMGIGIDHDTVCAGVVGTAIRHSTSCAGRRAAACSPAGRHNKSNLAMIAKLGDPKCL